MKAAQQRATIARMQKADELDQAGVAKRYDEAGLLAYYTFHLTYAPPSALDARPVFEP